MQMVVDKITGKPPRADFDTMDAEEEVDEEHLELVEMRLDVDVESLRSYLVANSDFPDGPVEIKQFNKGQSNPTVRVQSPSLAQRGKDSSRMLTYDSRLLLTAHV